MAFSYMRRYKKEIYFFITIMLVLGFLVFQISNLLKKERIAESNKKYAQIFATHISSLNSRHESSFPNPYPLSAKEYKETLQKYDLQKHEMAFSQEILDAQAKEAELIRLFFFRNFVLLLLVAAGVTGTIIFILKAKRDLQKLNKELQDSAFETSAIIEHAGCAMAHLDQNHNFQRVNENFLKLLGVHSESVDFNTYLNLLDKEQKEKLLRALGSGRESILQQKFTNYKGSQQDVDLRLNFFPNKKDAVLIAISTEDKIALQKALKKSNIFFNNSDLGHLILNEDHEILDANSSFCELMGYELSEIKHDHLSKFFKTNMLYETFVRNYLKSGAFSELNNLEYRLMRQDGTLFWAELFVKYFQEGEKKLSIWSVRDITVRVNSRNTIRNLNKSLQEQYEQLEEILDVIPMPVFIKDKNFNYTGCNEAFCKFNTTSKENLIGKSVFDLFEEDEAQFFQEQDKEMLQERYQVYQKHMKNSGKTIEVHKKSLFEDKEFNGFVGVIIDITEQEKQKIHLEKRVAQELEKNIQAAKAHQKEQLRNAKFSAIGKMAAGITHEINTPLTYIKGNLEMMQEDMRDIKEEALQKRMIDDAQIIYEGLERISKIIESMREISQKSTEAKEKTNIYNTLISSLILSFNRSKQIVDVTFNEEPFSLYTQKDAMLCFVMAQKQRLEQVWIIIINNALDELVKIEEFEKRKLAINLHCESENVIIDFHDNAGGISQTIMDRLFDPFESTKESSGIGLGLNIAKEIIDYHDGSIEAFNKDGGALFRVRLPLVSKEK